MNVNVYVVGTKVTTVRENERQPCGGLLIAKIPMCDAYFHKSVSEFALKQIISKVLKYDHTNIKKNYNGIVCIENADPGYDFLFNKGIKGLITKYGGANSHMAIRCMELQIPAIIGIGEKNFNHLKDKNSLLINCDQKFFKVLN